MVLDYGHEPCYCRYWVEIWPRRKKPDTFAHPKRRIKVFLREIQHNALCILFLGLAQFRADCPRTSALNRFDFHRNIVQKSVEGFDTGSIRLRPKHNPMALFPKHIQNDSLIVSLAYSIYAFLLGEFVLRMHCTHTARLSVVRNINIIIILKKTKILVIILFAQQIGTPHLASLVHSTLLSHNTRRRVESALYEDKGSRQQFKGSVIRFLARTLLKCMGEEKYGLFSS